MGWEVAEGPEVEAEWLNFDALNLGPDHPARTMQDTFWVKPGRAAAPDGAAHAHLAGPGAHDADARAADLRRRAPDGCSAPTSSTPRTRRCSTRSRASRSTRACRWPTSRARSTTSPRRCSATASTTRFRPSYFPFTEPSAEVDLLCYVCRNEPGVVDACRTCKGEGWIEWGGCGVVNPRVLIACGVDPERYSGFAFGMGLDRTITGRYEIADLRDLFDGDIRFTEPFGVGL